jgi:hypothetical protein
MRQSSQVEAKQNAGKNHGCIIKLTAISQLLDKYVQMANLCILNNICKESGIFLKKIFKYFSLEI